MSPKQITLFKNRTTLPFCFTIGPTLKFRMAAPLKLFGLSLLLNLLSNTPLSLRPVPPNEEPKVFPPGCTRIECPGYDVIQSGNGYEIRRYNTSVWMSTSPIQDISLVEATRTGFLQLSLL